MNRKIAIIGFGEAGSTFANAALWRGIAHAFDIKTEQLSARQQIVDACHGAGIVACDTLADALDGTVMVLSLVTADQALAAARDAAEVIGAGTVFLDMNSVAPQTKIAASELIEGAGGRYADVAIMSPVNPAGMAVPLLVSGPHTEEAAVRLEQLGFTNVRIVGDEVGRASTIKMLRSVMYKGVEALTAECLIACEIAGVTEEVLGSFGGGHGSGDWSSGADYRLDRMMVHGLRRAAEMEEVALTLEGLGVEPLMTRGTVERQRQLGALPVRPVPETLDAKLKRLAP